MRTPVCLVIATLTAMPLLAQAPERAIRRTIPIPRSMERAFAAGTRDSSGRPGARYLQLRTDYRIEARLDSATSVLTGHEVVTITNPTDSAFRSVGLRLYQNRFAPNVARAEPVVEITGGVTVTKVIANGQAVDLTRRTEGWKTTTVVVVPFLTPIPAHGTSTLEVEW